MYQKQFTKLAHQQKRDSRQAKTIFFMDLTHLGYRYLSQPFPGHSLAKCPTSPQL